MALQRFGILSPQRGMQSNVPHILLQDSVVAEKGTSNIDMRYGDVRKALMRSKRFENPAGGAGATAVTDPYLKLHWATETGTDGTVASQLFGFTKDKIYKWIGGGENGWTEHMNSNISGLTDTTQWSIVSFNGDVYATNGIDPILVGSVGTTFNTLGGESLSGVTRGRSIGGDSYLRRCKILTTFENHLIACNTEEGTGGVDVVYPHRIRWADIVSTDFDTGVAGFIDLDPHPKGNDYVTAAGLYQDFLVVFTSRSYHRLWLANPSPFLQSVFGRATLSREIGCLSPDSVVNGKSGELYFLASDRTFREIQFGEKSQQIDKVLKDIPWSYLPWATAGLDDKWGEIWLSFVYRLEYADGTNFFSIPAATQSSGSGLSDINTGGQYEGNQHQSTYIVQVHATGTPDTYKWSVNGGALSSAVEMDAGVFQELEDGVLIKFTASTGHTATNAWTFTVTAGNNRTLVYNPARETWVPRNFGVASFGKATISLIEDALTWNTLTQNHLKTDAAPVFTGSGNNDLTLPASTFDDSNADIHYRIRVSATPVSGNDRFDWSSNSTTSESAPYPAEDDSLRGSYATDVSMGAAPMTLENGVRIAWGAQEDHTLNDEWTFSVGGQGTGPYNTWDDWNWPSWDSGLGTGGDEIMLASDYSGNVFELNGSTVNDDGVEATGTVVLHTDLTDQHSVDLYKRISKIRVITESMPDLDTLTLAYKTDESHADFSDWDSFTLTPGAASATITTTVPCDILGKSFDFAISSSNPWKLIGLIFEFTWAGTD